MSHPVPFHTSQRPKIPLAMKTTGEKNKKSDPICLHYRPTARSRNKSTIKATEMFLASSLLMKVPAGRDAAALDCGKFRAILKPRSV